MFKNTLTTLAVLFLLGATIVTAQTKIWVPDANFRTALTTHSPSYGITQFADTVIVPNITNVTTLNLEGKNITNLTGANQFTSLQDLNCVNNFIDSLTIVSTTLQTLECAFNPQLKKLDINGATALTTLNCSNTVLDSLTIVSDLLKILYCSSPTLKKLDISGATALTDLYCNSTALDSLTIVSNSLKILNCSNIPTLKKLDISGATALTELYCGNSGLDSLTIVSTTLQTLNCRNNQLKKLDINGASALTTLECFNNQLSILNLFQNNTLTYIDVTGNPNLTKVYVWADPLNGVTVDKDAHTNLIVPKNNIFNPSVVMNIAGDYLLGSTGAIVEFTTGSSQTGTIAASSSTNPSIVGSLPTGIVSISPDKYWTITQTNLANFTYNLTVDLSGISKIDSFDVLKVLKRNDNQSAWEDVSTLNGVTVEYHNPYITVKGLTSFSDFAIGGDTNNAVLPVELQSFTAISQNGTVLLNWETISEINNEGFEIQKSSANQKSEWKKIGFVAGKGNSNEKNIYTFIDKNIVAGKNMYRLKQIDRDGKIKYSENVEMNFLPTSVQVSQNFPNPFNPTTTIDYQIPTNTLVTLKVYNVLGEEVATLVNEQKATGVYQAKFDGSSLSSGIYFYKLTAGKFTEVKKMMLLK